MPQSALSGELFRSLEKVLGFAFSDSHHLEIALTHSSYAKEHKHAYSNERLEFLGDSIFNMIIAHYLYQKFPQADEGKLSKLKSMLVAKKSLLELDGFLDLQKHLLVGNHESHFEESASREQEN